MKIKIKEIYQKLLELDYKHYLCVWITNALALFAIFVFPNAIVRILESCNDVWQSMKFYAQELFLANWNVRPTVMNVSRIGWTPIFGLPATWEEFEVYMDEYWKILFTKENFSAYMAFLSELLFNVSRILLLVVVPLFLLLYILFNRYLTTHNNDYDVSSKPLERAKAFGEKVWLPIKRWVRSFIDFVKENNVYYKIWIWIWAYNFNVITIVVEVFAVYFYFVVSFDF